MEYTITPQYHEKKGTEIYVLRLLDKVDRDAFTELSQLAKKYKGYYSSFRGVNGFVFKTEEAAENFAIQAESVLKQQEWIETESEKLSYRQSSEFKQLLTSGGRTLHEGLHHVIQMEGDNILFEARLINILDDLQVFCEEPSFKFILRAAITEGYTQKLLKLGTWKVEGVKLALQFSKSTGISQDLINLVFLSIAYGLEWVSKSEFSSMTSAIKEDLPKNNTYRAAKSQSQTPTHLEFMGQPICGKVSIFEKILTKKGFTGFINDPNYFNGPFAGIEDCYVTFVVSSFSKEVWQVKVNLSYSDDFLLNQERYFQMKEMFSMKYGVPESTEEVLSEIFIGDDREWFPFLNINADKNSPCNSVFHLDNGTITIQLAFHTVEIIYEDLQSKSLHLKKARGAAYQDI